MQALLIVIVTCHVSCVTVTACHTLAWVGEVPPSIDDLSELTCFSIIQGVAKRLLNFASLSVTHF